MPELGTSKYAYSYCQFIDPQQAHNGDCCDCFDTRSQKTKARAVKKLVLLRARKRTDKTPTPSSTESAVTSDPAVTPSLGSLRLQRTIVRRLGCIGVTVVEFLDKFGCVFHSGGGYP
jgi:hypothetical protein